MSSSDKNPASAAQSTADDSDGSESSEGKGTGSPKSKKKTMIGLGKLRKSLEKASSGKKGKSLRIPKPPAKKKKQTSLGLPRPGSDADRDDDDRDAGKRDDARKKPAEHEEVRSTLTLDPDELDEFDGLAEDSAPATIADSELVVIDDADLVEEDDGPPTDRIEASDLVEDVELDAGELPDGEMKAEATMLTDSPFEASGKLGFGAEPAGATSDVSEDDFGGDATMITDSMLGAQPEELDSAEEAFGGDATLVTDSLLGVDPDELDDFDDGDKTTVSMVGSPALELESTPKKIPTADKSSTPAAKTPPTDPAASARQAPAGPKPSPTPETHSTNPRPPDSGQSRSAPAQSGDLNQEGTLSEDSAPGEFHAEATEVFDSPYENEALVPRLSVLSGPATGQEFLLNKKRNTIGRGKNNTIMISDLAMSRQHLEIAENNDQSYTLIDLQSANGTRLNGTAIEEAELIHGDRVEAGKTEIQFVIPGNRPQQRSRNRRIVPKREVSTPGHNHTMVRKMGASGADDTTTTDRILTYVIIGAGVLSLCLIGAALFLYFNGDSADEPTAQASTAETPQAQVKYLEGVEKVKARDWAQARAIFEQLAAEQPEFPGVQAQLTRIEREEAALDKLERAQEAFEDGEQKEAARIAMSISNETAYFEDAQDLVRKTRQHRVAELYEKAQQAVTDEEFDAADEHLTALLEQVPNHKGALELRETIEAAQQEDQQDDPREAQERRAARQIVTQKPTRGSSNSNDDWLSGSNGSPNKSSRPASRGKVNFTEGFRLYKSGDFKAAAAHFRDIASGASGGLKTRADTAARSIDQFSSTYSRAERAFNAGAWKTAIDALAKAKRADRSVARSGYYTQKLGSKLATAHAKLGLAKAARGNFSSAAHHYKKGKSHGSSSQLNSLRRELSNQARSLYIQAANKRKTDPDKAAELCRQITSMVPSSHSMHAKATKMLEELE
ncbi:MAG: FHA domain-containing protein [Persicimonas sp.]